jgi:carbonic anhydrase/acetyltransferase-like protein (isoleucine patch superfamily)
MIQKAILLTPGKRVKKGELWAGRPAKLMRKIDKDEAARLRQTVENYLKRPRNYLGLDYPDTENA